MLIIKVQYVRCIRIIWIIIIIIVWIIIIIIILNHKTFIIDSLSLIDYIKTQEKKIL
jgi:hypothetical protein